MFLFGQVIDHQITTDIPAHFFPSVSIRGQTLSFKNKLDKPIGYLFLLNVKFKPK